MPAPDKHRSRKKLLIILSVLGLLIVVAIVGWNIYKYKFIRQKVKSAVYEKTNGLYTVHYDDMSLDEVAGDMRLINLRIVPDTAKFRQMIKNKTNPPLLLSLNVPLLEVSGVKTPDALLGKKLEGRKIAVTNADINFYYAKRGNDSSSETEKDEQEIYKQVLGELTDIKVDSIELDGLSLSFTDVHINNQTIEAAGISVRLRDILIDSAHSNETDRFFFAKALHFQAQKGTIKNKKGNYIYRFEDIGFEKADSHFTAKSIRVEPQFSEEKFAAISILQNDRFDFSFSQISLKHINLAALLQGDILADSLVIADSNFKVYRDLSYPRDTLNRVGKYPHQLLMRMPVNLNLKKLIVRNAFIEYKEKNPKSGYSGKVQFVNAGAVIDNITNDPAAIKRNNSCLLDFHARFLDMAPMNARVNMKLKDKNGRFLFSGSMKGFEAVQLNKIIEPMGLAKIEKGQVDKVNFNFDAHNYGSDGKVILFYHDLKLSLLKKDSADNQLKKKGLASFVANIFIKNDNPKGNKPVRVANVHYIRNTNRSFFNVMWKSIYAGVKESAGM